MTNWMEWLGLAAAFVAVLIAWDRMLCGRRRCARVMDRVATDEPRNVR